MHQVIEKARKAAGISSLKQNYPEDPKQRGCGHWAAFIGVLNEELTQLDEEELHAKREIAVQQRRIAELQRDIAEAQDCAVA